MFSVEDSLKMWVSASNYTNGADYADECFIPFFQGSSLLRECCRNVLFYDLKKFWTQRSHPQTTLSIKLVVVSKQIRKLYRISCSVNSKLPKFYQIHSNAISLLSSSHEIFSQLCAQLSKSCLQFVNIWPPFISIINLKHKQSLTAFSIFTAFKSNEVRLLFALGHSTLLSLLSCVRGWYANYGQQRGYLPPSPLPIHCSCSSHPSNTLSV